MNRRRINSERPVAYTSGVDRVTVAMRPSSVNYENNDFLEVEQRVTYTKQTDQVTFGPAPRPSNYPSLASPTSLSTGLSNVSLRSDCDALLTPNSKSSGVGSLNGNASAPSNGNPPPIPPSLSDPWKRHPNKCSKLFFSPCVPQSARDYVNTTNAFRDVSGTPLPATAVGAMHFSFDFDHSAFPRRPGSAGLDRSRLNYVPVELELNCGASSTSSGIPGTPRTPKTPKTPLLANTEYAVIDQTKTVALSHAYSHRARQRERKSRHTSTEVSVNPL